MLIYIYRYFILINFDKKSQIICFKHVNKFLTCFKITRFVTLIDSLVTSEPDPAGLHPYLNESAIKQKTLISGLPGLFNNRIKSRKNLATYACLLCNSCKN